MSLQTLCSFPGLPLLLQEGWLAPSLPGFESWLHCLLHVASGRLLSPPEFIFSSVELVLYMPNPQMTRVLTELADEK